MNSESAGNYEKLSSSIIRRTKTKSTTCKNLNRNFVGYELNEEYYRKSIERLKNE